MGLYILKGAGIYKLFEVFVKMAVVIVPICRIVEIGRRTYQVLCCFPYPHDLESLFTGDACTGFEISLKGSSGDTMPFSKLSDRCIELIYPETFFQYLTYYSGRLEGAFIPAQ